MQQLVKKPIRDSVTLISMSIAAGNVLWHSIRLQFAVRGHLTSEGGGVGLLS